MVPSQSARIYRFGPYELHANAGELRKHGIRLKLQGQPLQLLAALVQAPGEILTREKLQSRLWPADTFVDFENGLNSAVKRLRVALSDSADQPVYIETVARSGYRFIAPVTEVEERPSLPVPAVSAPRRQFIGYGVAGALGAAATWVGIRQPLRRPAAYRQVTFRRGHVWNARYAPDGQTILYAAQFDGQPREIYSNNGVSPESRALGLEGSVLFSVSRRGELALNRFGGIMPITGGTLERVPMNGGTPLVVERNIMSADWAPAGDSLALVRAENGANLLEYPSGKVLHQCAGWLSSVRVSPDGEFVAFMEHPVRHDDAGFLRVMNREGRTVGQTDHWAVAGGLAWKTNRELWLTAGNDGPKALWSCDLQGRVTPLEQAPGMLTLADVAANRALLIRTARRLEMTGSLAGGAPRELSLHDWSRVAGVSTDGRLVLFDESAEAVGGRPVSYLLDGQRGGAVRLADSAAYCLSPDGELALLAGASGRGRLRLFPIGGGTLEDLPDRGFQYQWAAFYPDGRHVFALGTPNGGGLGIYRHPLRGDGPLTALTPPGMVRHAAISPDGRRLAVLAADGKLRFYPADSPGEPTVLETAEPLAPIRWQAGGRHLFVQHLGAYTAVPTRVSLLHTETGAIRHWKELGPADAMGVNSVTRVIISGDERSWVCSYRRILSELFQMIS
ncbi:MAG: winged helix-turn-helix domain-containing protein [Bryobacterales bacterium]|nr:winged helix-turn-helix domain-containing protein [Bryobacterales bacterium]